MKYYLAFKGVRENYRSLFVEGKLSKEYRVNKIVRSRNKLWMFLPPPNLSTRDTRLFTGADNYCRKVLLVRINRKNVSYKKSPWLIGTHNSNSWKKIYKNIIFDTYNHLCNRLKVLEEVDMSKFISTNEAMAHYEKKYGLSRLPVNIKKS